MDSTKRCVACGEVKLREAFYVSYAYGKPEYTGRCKPCHNEYTRRRRMIPSQPRRPALERVMESVIAHGDDECWEWTGSTDAEGRIGSFHVGSGKTKRATQIMWESVNGPLGPMRRVRATCGNTLCTNPKHLEAIFISERTKDGTMKGCALCGQLLPVDQFYTERRDGTISRWPVSYCRSCCAEHQRAKKYGLRPGEYMRMLERQNGNCAICDVAHSDRSPLVVDHDHATGAVRGLLCQPCNSGIGFLQERTDILQSAILYLTFCQSQPRAYA